MIEFYPQIKAVHVAAVIASGLLFAVRGAGLLIGHRWPNALAVRITSWTIDTTLLTAALMLFTLLPKEMFGNGWLLAKIVLLVLYIGLGTMALGKARTRGTQTAFFLTALATFVFIVTIARAHHPLGMFFSLIG